MRWLAPVLLAGCATVPTAPGLAVTHLTCNYATDPVIDDEKPVFAWRLESNAPDTRQVAYRITADEWDSGRVASDRSFAVAYGGSLLQPRSRHTWRVTVWDNHGRSATSAPAHWEMGLHDWSAKWIGATRDAPAFGDTQWIWFPEDNPPIAERYFRRAFDAKAGRAQVLITCDNRFTLYVNGAEAGRGDDWQRPQRIDIELRDGRNVIAVAARNDGGPAALLMRLDAIATDASWRCRNAREDGWAKPEFDDSGWPMARELGAHGAAPWGRLVVPDTSPLPIFRKSFMLDARPARARLYLCGLGNGEAEINGTRVGDDALEPGWTDYRRRCLYTTHDVTSLLRAGENAITVLLGNGMYNVTAGRYAKFRGSLGTPRLIAQLEADSRVVAATDGTWQVAPGPITFSCVYGGEDHDARRVPVFRAAVEVPGPGGTLRARNFPPVRAMKVLAPVAVTRPRPGIVVYDFGENMSGRPAIRVRGKTGQSVRITPAETLRDGVAFQCWSGGPAHWTYTLAGGGVEEWRPRFSYYGFRWLQVEGVEPERIEAEFLHASVATTGFFRCSDELLNRTHAIIVQAIRSNMHSVFTDCPHREKFGWLEEVHLMGPAILANFDAAALCAKVMRDMTDAQYANGMVPTTAPEYMDHSWAGEAFRDSPEWGSACVIAPWLVYERTGDARFLAEGYETAKRYMNYLASRAKGHVLRHGLGDWSDVGSAVAGHGVNTPVPIVATAIWHFDALVMAKAARVLGRDDGWDALAGRIRDAFNRELWKDARSQAALSMALALGLLPEDRRAAAFESLVADVRKRGHTTTGDVGHRFFLRALAEGGRSDLILAMARRTEHPSYGYQIKYGATSLTEAWDGPTAGASQNHFMMGHIDEWFFRDLAGLDVDCSRADAPIVIRPHALVGLEWVEAQTGTPWGPVRVRWSGDVLECTVPANAQAEVVWGTARRVGSGTHRLIR